MAQMVKGGMDAFVFAKIIALQIVWGQGRQLHNQLRADGPRVKILPRVKLVHACGLSQKDL